MIFSLPSNVLKPRIVTEECWHDDAAFWDKNYFLMKLPEFCDFCSGID